MKKLSSTLACSFLSVLFAYGQGNSQGLNESPAVEMNFVRSLWFASGNAAGMAFNPLIDYGLLSMKYNLQSGDYKQQQRGDRERDMAFSTSGAIRVDKFLLWGDFNFSNRFVSGSTYNTNMYDPRPDMPYYVADTVYSDWKQQSYDMSLKAALPLLDDRLAVGMAASYFTGQAAKQMDPRSVVLKYGISVEPSVVYRLNSNNSLGLTALYYNTFDRNSFTNSNNQVDQKVSLTKGLGNYSTAFVGGLSGLDPWYYKGNTFGGSLQYGHHNSALDALADIFASLETVDVNETPSKPHKRGTTDKMTFGANLQVLLKAASLHKISLSVKQSSTDGTEYIQELNNDPNVKQWVTISQNVKSTYLYRSALLNYAMYLGAADAASDDLEDVRGYAWKIGANVAYTDREDKYLLPESWFRAQNLFAELTVKKSFSLFASSVVVLGVKAGYRKGLDGEYVFGGSDTQSRLVTDFYPLELQYLKSDYLSAGCGLNWSFPLKKTSSLILGIDWRYQKVVSDSYFDGTNRSFLDTSLSYLF